MNLRNIWYLLIFAGLLALCSCNTYQDSLQLRAKLAKESKGDLVIGIVWSFKAYKDLYLEGIQLAVDEVNQAGGVLGRKLRILVRDGEHHQATGLQIARDFAKDPNIIAAIGYLDSGTAIGASITFENHGMLLISPRVTNPLFTQHDFKYSFRTIPNDKELGKKLIEYGHSQNHQSIIIISDGTVYGRGFSNILLREASDRNIRVHRMVYPLGERGFRGLVSEIRILEHDAIYLAGHMPDMAYLIKQTRDLGITAPFLAGESLDSPELRNVAGDACEGAVLLTIYNPHEKTSKKQNFIDRFQTKFNKAPDTWAAQGYDAVNLLADTIKSAKSAVPAKLADMLRFTENWEGVNGKLTFKKNGDIIGDNIYVVKIKGGNFEYLPDPVVAPVPEEKLSGVMGESEYLATSETKN